MDKVSAMVETISSATQSVKDNPTGVISIAGVLVLAVFQYLDTQTNRVDKFDDRISSLESKVDVRISSLKTEVGEITKGEYRRDALIETISKDITRMADSTAHLRAEMQGIGNKISSGERVQDNIRYRLASLERRMTGSDSGVNPYNSGAYGAPVDAR